MPQPLADIERHASKQLTRHPTRVREPDTDHGEAGHTCCSPSPHESRDVQFAVKGMTGLADLLSALRRFDYPGIYTSVVTCLSSRCRPSGRATRRPLLRFGAPRSAVHGGGRARVRVSRCRGSRRLWLSFHQHRGGRVDQLGSPRISYGGYQFGLAFYRRRSRTSTSCQCLVVATD